MFADLRGFTALAERLYPYDSVFLLNRYFDVMAQAIERHGGEVDKFLGDGIMALFGVTPARGAGSRDALLAARDMLDALEPSQRGVRGDDPGARCAWASGCIWARPCWGASAAGGRRA